MGIILWPLKFILSLTSAILSLCGRLITIVLGLALCAAGLILCLTLIGIWLGIPLAILGLIVMVRGVLG